MDLDTEEGLRELASQLGNPTGELGIIVAERMHANNLQMTRKTVESLHLKDTDIVLEIGPGSAAHVTDLLHRYNINYYGIDISGLMVEQASKINAHLIEGNKATILLYDGTKLPFPDAYFDKVMTVNTIYFWENPEIFLKEIQRVMKPNTIFSICFGNKTFMEKMPFTQYGFRLYTNKQAKQLASNAGFEIVNSIEITDQVSTQNDTLMDRVFTLLTVEKK